MLTSPFDNSQNTATSIASTLFATPKSPAGPSPSGGGTSAVLGASGSTPGVVPGAGTTEADVFRPITSNMGNAFDGGSSFLGQSKATTTSDVTPADSNPRKVMGGIRVMLPASKINPFVTMTATPGTSLEELWVRDCQQNRKVAGVSDQMSSGAQAAPTTNLFGAPMKIQDSLVGGAAVGTFGVTASQPVTSPLGTPEQQRSTIGTDTGQRTVTGGSASENPKSASSAGRTFGQPSPIKLERIEELLRRTLLGEELVNTQFHLFSARSSTSGRVMKPHVLYANNALLAKSSNYFLDLLSADVNSSDPSLVDLVGDNDVPSSVSMDDYGYEDDSDLDNYDDPIPGTDPDGVKNRSVGSQTFRSKVSVETRPKDGNNLEHPRTTEPFSVNKDEARSVASSESAVRETGGNNRLGNQTTVRLRSLGSRHVLVRDGAFQTWFTLLDYLYTGKFSFLPLSSTTPGVRRASLANSLHAPRCSAKSMYRLASKVKLDYLRDAAFSYIRSNLTEHNILKELSSSIVSKYPQLLEMELDILYSHIASRPVVAKFASLAQRIAHKELPHGADIIVGIHTRLLKERHPFSLKPARFTFLPNLLGPPEPVKTDVSISDAPEAGAKQKTGSPHMDQRSTQSRSDSGGSETIPGVQPQASSDVAVSTATPFNLEPDTGGTKRATDMHKGC